MPKLPQTRPQELVKILHRRGFISRKTKGSHVFFQHSDGRTTVVPIHNKTIPNGTLRGILKQTKISVEELIEEL